MREILRGYEVNAPTWFYLGALLIVAVFFRFSRLWSTRNLDLALLLSLSPGLLFVRFASANREVGYIALFVLTGLILIRVCIDPLLTRRPRLEQNLNNSGMVFLCLSALVFQTANIMMNKPHEAAVETVRQAENRGPEIESVSPQYSSAGTYWENRPGAGESKAVTANKVTATVHETSGAGESGEPATAEAVPESGPATALLARPVVALTSGAGPETAARCLAIVAHIAVCLGLLAVGSWHFADKTLGVAMAAMYLLLPSTAYDVTRVTHLLPAALIVWGVATHHRPLIAGTLLGLACGTMVFPVFLVPIWLAFYWKRGALRFTSALALTGTILLTSVLLTSADAHSFTRRIVGTIYWDQFRFDSGEGEGFWSVYDQSYRVPVFVAFVLLLGVLTAWPTRKNLEHLLSHSAAIVVATQFWYPHQGGVYVLWYVPLLLMIVFRPRLAHLPAVDSAEEVAGSARPTLLPPSFPRESSRGQVFQTQVFR